MARVRFDQLPLTAGLLDTHIIPLFQPVLLRTERSTIAALRDLLLASVGGGAGLVAELDSKADKAEANTFTQPQWIAPTGLPPALSRILQLRAPMTAPAVNNSGVGILFGMHSAAGVDSDSAALDIVWTNATTKTSSLALTLFDAGTPQSAFTVMGTGGLLIRNVAAYTLRSFSLFAASGTWTRPGGCRAIRVRAQAGGGGGGHANNGGTGYSAGGGGGGGCYGEKFIVSPGATESVVIGAGGAGGVAGAGGGFGGTTSFGSHFALAGALGGSPCATTTTTLFGAAQGVGGTILSGSCDLLIPGGHGPYGMINSAGQALSGGGGNSYWGHGGIQLREPNPGMAGRGYGSGGGGGAGTAATLGAGGNGAPGFLIVEEYF